MSGKLALAKMAINLIAGAGVSKVVNDVIRNNTTLETPRDVAEVWVGSVVIGSMVADAGQKHVNAKLDKAVAWWEERKTKANAETE